MYMLKVNCLHFDTTSTFQWCFNNRRILSCLKCKKCSDRYQLHVSDSDIENGNIIINQCGPPPPLRAEYYHDAFYYH